MRKFKIVRAYYIAKPEIVFLKLKLTGPFANVLNSRIINNFAYGQMDMKFQKFYENVLPDSFCIVFIQDQHCKVTIMRTNSLSYFPNKSGNGKKHPFTRKFGTRFYVQKRFSKS